MLLTLILTLTLSHFLTVSLFLTLTLNLSLNHSWHAEQLLFSSLCSKITVTLSHSHALTLSHSHTFTLFQCLIQSLLTCWTSIVFMSMLISRCLLPKLAMVFFWQPQQHHPLLWVLSSESWFPAKNLKNLVSGLISGPKWPKMAANYPFFS